MGDEGLGGGFRDAGRIAMDLGVEIIVVINIIVAVLMNISYLLLL